MHIRDMNWKQVEDYLKGDDRAVLPIGSTEQHAQLSLMVDAINPERVSVEAAAPLGIPVFPTVNYGLTPYFTAYPGTVTLRCQWRSIKGPPRRCKKGPLGGCGLVPVVHGRAPCATRRALNRLTRRRTREGPVGPRGQAWAGWSVQLAVGV